MIILPALPLVASLFAPTVGPATRPGVIADSCALASPDAQATLGVDNDGNAVHFFGKGYGDGARTCKRYVADFSVLPDANPQSNLELNFNVHGEASWMPDHKTACDQLKVSNIFYKKAAGAGGFAKIGTLEYTGSWTAYPPKPDQLFGPTGLCTLKFKSGAMPKGKPNAAGVDIYRVAVRVTWGGEARSAQASIGFIMTPPS
jgi:hypothetical protein